MSDKLAVNTKVAACPLPLFEKLVAYLQRQPHGQVNALLTEIQAGFQVMKITPNTAPASADDNEGSDAG